MKWPFKSYMSRVSEWCYAKWCDSKHHPIAKRIHVYVRFFRRWAHQQKPSHLWAGGIALFCTLWILSGVLTGHDRPPLAYDSRLSEKNVPEVGIEAIYATDTPIDIQVFGVTEADKLVELKAETKGPVKQVLVPDGTVVKADTPLIEINIMNRKILHAEARALVEQRILENNAAQELYRAGHQAKIRATEVEAQLKAAEALLAAIELDINKTKIMAPFDGIFNKSDVETGDFVETGTVVGVIASLDPMVVSARVSENLAPLLEVGMEGTAIIRGEAFPGKIRWISMIADPKTRTFPFEFVIHNPEHLLKQGQTAEIQMSSAPVPAFQIPTSALSLTDDGRVGVKFVNKANKIEFFPASIINQDRDSLWIRAGKRTELNIVPVGHDFVVEGQLVKPVSNSKIQDLNETKP